MVASDLDSRIARFRATPFHRALLKLGDEYCRRETAPDWYREALARVRGREAEFLRESVLPRIDRQLALDVLAELDRGGEHAIAVLVAAMHAMPTHRPRFIAEEVVKTAAPLETDSLAHALELLSPRSFFETHLGDQAAPLRASDPGAFERPVEGRDDLLHRALRLRDAAHAAGPEARAAWEAWSRLVTESTAFDYGCGAGALMRTMARDFAVAGGDLFEGRPSDVMCRPLAVLRTVASPEDAVAGDGRIHGDRVMTLDQVPGPGSPPGARRYSVVTSIGVMEHVTDPEAFDAVMRKMMSLLHPGGILLVNASPTVIGHDVHHALNPWMGVLLHRAPFLARLPGLRSRWHSGFCRPVRLGSLLRPVEARAAAVAHLWPNPRSVRRRLGPASGAALPVLQAAARKGLGLVHHVAISSRLALREGVDEALP